MMVCPKCGAEIENGAYVCSNCGEEINCDTYVENNNYTYINNGGTLGVSHSIAYSQKAMLCLSYVGFLVIIPFLFCKNTSLTRFHINQGIMLLITEIIYAFAYLLIKSVLLAISMWLYVIVAVMAAASIVFAVYAIMGIVSVIKNEKRELPVIGSYAILK